MSSRSSNVRIKVTALLVSLVALWAFAAFVTLREGLSLLWVSTLDRHVGRPTEALVAALQQERRLSLVYLVGHNPERRTALNAGRERTDGAKATFQKLARGSDVEWAADAAVQQRIDEALGQFESLDRVRRSIDTDGIDRGRAALTFNDIIDAGFRIFSSNAGLDDQNVAKEGRTLIALTRAHEVLSREDALLAGVLAAGRFTGGEHAQFVELVGTQRFLFAEAAAELPDADRVRYQELARGANVNRFRTLEDLVVGMGRAGAPAPVTADDWKAAVEPILAGVRSLVLSAGDGLIERAKPVAVWVLVRLLLAGGLGLIAVIASIIVSITTARALVQQLEKLCNAALDLANRRLPQVVDRLQRGEEVDVATEAPPLAFGSDEIGQVGQAFNLVQKTAVRTAVEQAELRKSVRDVFLSLARRTQAHVHRQLKLLDAIERRETNAEELEDLFRVDHLATRMRRNAENLIVLSGAATARGWRRSVPFIDVIRGAVAEVEDYTRVTVLPVAPAALAGRAVGDVIHLLAELIENATSFSPPYTVVQVAGHRVANGFAVEVEDRGLGMSESALADANEQVTNALEFKLSSTARLGLYVVGRLAARHGIKVRLKESPYGGTSAVVLIPTTLVTDIADAGVHREHAADESATASTGNGSGRKTIEIDPPVPRQPAPQGANHPALDHPTLANLPTPRLLERQAGRQSEQEPAGSDPVGLPRRVRQASIAAPLREHTPAEHGPAAGPDRRAPEDTRRMMTAYQAATTRGRAEAQGLNTNAAGHDDTERTERTRYPEPRDDNTVTGGPSGL